MKSLNDIEILGVLGAAPQRSEVPGRAPGRKELRLHFPMAWTQAGMTSVITVTAIGESAQAIAQHAVPGDPLLITGTLTKYDGGVRCKMVSSGRAVTDFPTIQVDGPRGPLLSLDGGEASVHLRGHVHEDSRVVHGRFHTSLAVRSKDGDFVERYTLVADQPLFGGQGVTVEGQFLRYVNQEESEGVIVARRVRLSERLTGPASMTNRDPQDRLRLHRLSQEDQRSLSAPG